jgi:hypothetical protein
VRAVQDPTGGDADGERPQPSPVPFVVALVGFLVLATLAYVFLRADDEGRLVRPDRLTATGDDTLRATALGESGCGRIQRAQVELTETEVLVELVAVDADGPCADVTVDLVAEITLPEPIGDRTLLAGVGRLHIPCTGDGTDVTCRPGA